MSMDSFWAYFYEIYEEMPRQGPGDGDSTRRALTALPELTREQRILDIGCGSGAQTIDLARATNARISAVDNHPPFVLQLAENARQARLGERVSGQVADMSDLPFPDESFDLLWSEGAIFIMGFAKGLKAWRRLLVPGGHVVVSEFCWFSDDPPPEVREMFGDDVADVGTIEERRKSVAQSGYRLLEDFVLPAIGWWDNYYVPLSECLERFRARHADNPDALAVAARSEREIELYRRFADTFGYSFFVMQKDDSIRES